MSLGQQGSEAQPLAPETTPQATYSTASHCGLSVLFSQTWWKWWGHVLGVGDEWEPAYPNPSRQGLFRCLL